MSNVLSLCEVFKDGYYSSDLQLWAGQVSHRISRDVFDEL